MYELDAIAAALKTEYDAIVAAGFDLVGWFAERGHAVTLFETRDHLGGQFRLAMNIPGKEEFDETLRSSIDSIYAASVS